MSGAVQKLAVEQLAAVEAIYEAIAKRENFTLQGLAGTGKTTVAAYVAQSQDGAFLCAPTGKAASVLRAKTGLPATTVHRAFYEFVSAVERDGASPRLMFRPAHPPGSLRGNVLLLDECSMISREVARDILMTGITIISIGDPGQLPPIDGPQFFTEASLTLAEVHRQALESPIIRQAHKVRAGGDYAPDGAGFRVEERLSKQDLLTADIVLTWKRETRSRVNAAARTARGLASLLPVQHEPLVCLRNLPRHGLYNGAIYTASRDLCEGDETIGISTDDGDIEVHADFLPPEREDAALDLPPGGWKTAFAFGYALTVHKAQGSEFDKVVLVDEYTRPEDRVAWVYTALTRARQEIIILPRRDRLAARAPGRRAATVGSPAAAAASGSPVVTDGRSIGAPSQDRRHVVPAVTKAEAIDDRAWFGIHPNRRYRLRGEWIIRRRSGGVLLRTRATTLPPDTDKALREAWFAAAWPGLTPPERAELVRQAARMEGASA